MVFVVDVAGFRYFACVVYLFARRSRLLLFVIVVVCCLTSVRWCWCR